MANQKKGKIKINAKHGGKEFQNNFHFVGLVKPVQKKDNTTDTWFDAEIFDVNETATKRERRVLQFNVETAKKNELKVELGGMENENAVLYSSTEKQSKFIAWNDRFDKDKYPNETYHLIETDWDKTLSLSKLVEVGMWVEVKGHYEFREFINTDGEKMEFKQRIIDYIIPLKNGKVTINSVNKGDTFRAFSDKEGTVFLGQGKGKDDGKAEINVGWLNPSGGKLYLCKVENDTNGDMMEVEYNESTCETERIKVENNITGQIRLPKEGGGFEYVDYVRDFDSEDFKEINKFEMQIGVKSAYQDEITKNTKVNAVYLSYGKERSNISNVELDVFYKEPTREGADALADAFGRLERGVLMVVEGIDNNRAEFALVEVQDEVDDNPFLNVEERTPSYERVTTGTKKGLEILSYVNGSYVPNGLSDEEIDGIKPVDEISSDDLPF